MAEETWHAARLIPTSGINGPDEQERRATSALLAVMAAVREFGRTVTSRFGAPAGVVETFIEVPFVLGERRHFPDGLLRVSRGSRTWTALVEVKTGNNCLLPDQIEAYLDIAREQGFDAVLTISNQIPSMPGIHPCLVDKRKTKRVALHHMSWTQVLTEAVIQKVHRGVADPDQAWILGELIRYLEHPKSGALEFDDMGPAWVTVREAVSHGTLRASDKGAAEVASRWDQLIRYLCLRLGRQLGTEVQPILSRREISDPAARAQTLLTSIVSKGVLDAAIRIPNAAGPVTILADLRAGRVTCSVDIDAPRDGRQLTKVNWLVRQLKAAPDGARVDAFAQYGRGASTSELLRDVRANPTLLLDESKRDLRTFRITLAAPLGAKRGQARGSFVSSVLELADVFYETVVQTIRSAPPPKLREQPVVPEPRPEGAPDLSSTALSSQDGAVPANRSSSSSDAPLPTLPPQGLTPAAAADDVALLSQTEPIGTQTV